MPVGIEDQGRKFITTEPIGKGGEDCEQKVWDAVRDAFARRDCIGYWCYPIFSKTGETRKEPDIMVADKELGIIIIEVKCITIDQIVAVNGHQWEFQKFYTAQGSPYKQAENQLYSLLGYCDREEAIRRQVTGRAIVALPLITERQWQEKGFDRLPSCPPIIFKEQLGEASLLEYIEKTTPVVSGKDLDDKQWELLLAVIGGMPVLRKPREVSSAIALQSKTRSSIINTLRDRLYELDLQQVHVGLEIPPGPQRIRGIAGSGKTVLLCQKAAHMHLKHPDWDIALVFFTRSLYDQIYKLVDNWIRHFSCGDRSYDSKAREKLLVLHTWGAYQRPGLYGTICAKNGYKRLTVTDTDYRKPNEGLADVCRKFFESLKKEGRTIKPMFDAILVDEGQDLAVNGDELKYEDKQVIYWMAWQSLRPVDLDTPNTRRLIWAYDEAQSLDTLKIPEYKEVFGKNLGEILSGQKSGPTYKGGIKKNEVMHRCYRTPGPILTAAHAIGMGLLRPEGMLSGITNAEHWQKIGYEVTGDFRRVGQQITLHRPPKNSPNPVPDLWGEPVINVDIYNSRQEELTFLAQHIKHNKTYDGLQPSREILVVVLGNVQEAIDMETHVAEFLIQQGIDIYVPAAPRINNLKFHWQESRPDVFWEKNAVTVSRIHRAKGNEADMVYVVGFDNVAKNEDDITLRNQLFVALTRARGWVRLSGVGNYPMYNEMQQVIASSNTFTFIYNKPPKRDVGEEEDVQQMVAVAKPLGYTERFSPQVERELCRSSGVTLPTIQAKADVINAQLGKIGTANKAHNPAKTKLRAAIMAGDEAAIETAKALLLAIEERGTNSKVQKGYTDRFIAGVKRELCRSSGITFPADPTPSPDKSGHTCSNHA